MSRLELFYSCVSNMVSLFHHTGCDDVLKVFENYLTEEDRNNTIYRCKPKDAKSRLEKVAVEYKNLERLLDEQVIFTEGEFQLQEPKRFPAGSLQNPSDPDASYRFKAGRKHTGYVENFVEKVDENGSCRDTIF